MRNHGRKWISNRSRPYSNGKLANEGKSTEGESKCRSLAGARSHLQNVTGPL
jgi:hypothetical protein